MAAFVIFTACGSTQTTSLDSLYQANTLEKAMDSHSSVYEEFSYYENFDSEVTYKTTYWFGSDESGDLLYTLDSYDVNDELSEDNFSYCILKNVEYYFDNANNVNIFPLTSEYLDELYDHSIALTQSDNQTITSKKTMDGELVVNATADITDEYSTEDISSMNSICGSELTGVKYIYNFDKDTQLLNSAKLYMTADDGTEFLFCEENITYDAAEPDLTTIASYIAPDQTRTVTIIEMNDDDKVTNTYKIPATSMVNLRCFTETYDFEIFNDADGLDPFIKETADETGVYPSVTYYAIPRPDESSNTSTN